MTLSFDWDTICLLLDVRIPFTVSNITCTVQKREMYEKEFHVPYNESEATLVERIV